jgi:hypothetical protein
MRGVLLGLALIGVLGCSAEHRARSVLVEEVEGGTAGQIVNAGGDSVNASGSPVNTGGTPIRVCDPGLVQCVHMPDSVIVRECPADGSGWVTYDCPEGQVCVESVGCETLPAGSGGAVTTAGAGGYHPGGSGGNAGASGEGGLVATGGAAGESGGTAGSAGLFANAGAAGDIGCPQERLLANGRCCPEGHRVCDGVCTEIMSSRSNCGACGIQCENSEGEPGSCVDGQCLCFAPAVDACAFGNVRRCTDVFTHPLHCGRCGQACSETQVCEDGSCRCPGTSMWCSPGLCVYTGSDPYNCGGCLHECHETEICHNGNCECPEGEAWCQEKCIDVLSDPRNCGACDNGCRPDQTCYNGGCGCIDHEIECDGVCTDTRSDVSHCGGCTIACLVEEEECIDGYCVPLS